MGTATVPSIIVPRAVAPWADRPENPKYRPLLAVAPLPWYQRSAPLARWSECTSIRARKPRGSTNSCANRSRKFIWEYTDDNAYLREDGSIWKKVPWRSSLPSVSPDAHKYPARTHGRAAW